MDKKTLKFENLILDVVNKSNKAEDPLYKRLVNGISGCFESGKLSVIMGPNGGGKTSFLNVLTGKVQNDSKTYGNVLYNGVKRNLNTWLSDLAYLEQEEDTFPFQTVFEYIYFTAKCRNRVKTEQELLEAIDKVLIELEILNTKSIFLSALSGGELKRVKIAAELLCDASIMIFDEPTSSLDSNIALKVVNVLKRCAKERNAIVIITIHQPGPAIFDMFDDFMFINRGHCIYFGLAREVDKFLEERNIVKSGPISTSEFIFELFSESSVYPGISEEYGKVKEFMDTKVMEASERTLGLRLKSGNEEIINYSLEIKKVFLITMRQLKIYLRGKEVIVLGFVLLFLPVISIYSYVESFLNVAFAQSYINLPKNIVLNIPLYKSIFHEDFNDILSTVFMITYYITMCLGFSFYTPGILKYKEPLLAEYNKGTYSTMTLYASVIINEIVFGIFKLVLFLLVVIIAGYSSSISLYLIIYIAVITILFSFLSVAFYCINRSEILMGIVNPIKIIIGMFFRGLPIYFLMFFLDSLENGSVFLKLLPYLRFLLLPFWCPIFFDSYMRIKLIRSLFPSLTDLPENTDQPNIFLKNGTLVKNIPKDSLKLLYLKFMSNVLSTFIPSNITDKNILILKEKAYIYEYDFLDEIFIVFTLLSASLICYVSIYFIRKSVPNKLRLNL